MDKMGCMNYAATPWEKVNDSPSLEQCQQFYKLNHFFDTKAIGNIM